MSLLLGRPYYKVFWFPIGYLVFMLPFWSFIRPSLYLPLQLISAKIGVSILNVIGIPVYHNGIYIDLPNIKLVVAEACSGARYLFSVIAVVFAASYLFVRGWGRRTILILISLVVSILSNGVRIALISLLAYRNVNVDIHGPYHVLYGSMISVMGFIAIFIGVFILRENTVSMQSDVHLDQWALDKHSYDVSSRWKVASISVFMILCLTGSYLNFYVHKPTLLKRNMQDIPYILDGWEGVNEELIYRNFHDGGADSELSRRYLSKTGERLHLYIAYFSFQKQGKEIVNYNTEDLDEGKKPFYFKTSNKDVRIAKTNWNSEKNKNFTVLYWYDVNGRIIANRYLAKLWLAYDGLLRRRTNGAVVMLLIERDQPNASLDVPDNMVDFVQAVFPVIARYLEV
jgi:EpsI family protein